MDSRPDLTDDDYDPLNFPSLSPLLNGCSSESISKEWNINLTALDDLIPVSDNSSSSSTQSYDNLDLRFLFEPEPVPSSQTYEYSVSNPAPPSDGLRPHLPATTVNPYEFEKLEIIAQPNSRYRPRFCSEMREVNRYIRTNKGNAQYPYPTIKIPLCCHPNAQWFISVTLVTIIGDGAPQHCIHPHDIDTSDQYAIKDPANNSLYFRINENEYRRRTKSFCLKILKKKKEELETLGAMRLFNHGQGENIVIEDVCNLKHRKILYQFSKSQIMFTIAQKLDDRNDFILLHRTSVASDIMTEEIETGSASPRNHPARSSTDQIRCIPQQGNWEGGDEIVLLMPYPIKKNKYELAFDFNGSELQTIEIDCVDTRTIVFRTPKCPLPVQNELSRVSIIIHKNQSLLSTIDFYYIPPNKKSISKRSFVQEEEMNNRGNKKTMKDYHYEDDNAEGLVRKMDLISIREMYSDSTSSTTLNNEKFTNLNKRLGKIKFALEDFVRTNNPSELFRVTGSLLSKYSGSSSPLIDAIQSGHTSIALAVIEQTNALPSPKNLLEKANENGETPLLIAAKFNQWKIVELILKYRSDLIKQKDNDGNNLLHFLANLTDDKGAETIEEIFKILPDKSMSDLINEQNQQNQTPIDIAHTHHNTIDLKIFEYKQKIF